ncbi:hypothetical protein IRB23M11_18000 [Alkalibacterium sp. m-11]|uniref:Uncharacterized protein n=1 Tax=Alkalibacterium indicireducens TaxID=398758 RepID=A0ABN1ALT7_9LACT
MSQLQHYVDKSNELTQSIYESYEKQHAITDFNHFTDVFLKRDSAVPFLKEFADFVNTYYSFRLFMFETFQDYLKNEYKVTNLIKSSVDVQLFKKDIRSLDKENDFPLYCLVDEGGLEYMSEYEALLHVSVISESLKDINSNA